MLLLLSYFFAPTTNNHRKTIGYFDQRDHDCFGMRSESCQFPRCCSTFVGGCHPFDLPLKAFTSTVIGSLRHQICPNLHLPNCITSKKEKKKKRKFGGFFIKMVRSLHPKHGPFRRVSTFNPFWAKYFAVADPMSPAPTTATSYIAEVSFFTALAAKQKTAADIARVWYRNKTPMLRYIFLARALSNFLLRPHANEFVDQKRLNCQRNQVQGSCHTRCKPSCHNKS